MNNNILNEKRILFIWTPFHEYPLKIKLAIEALNGKVDLFYINKKSFFSTILLNLSKSLLAKYRTYQQNNILRKVQNTHYDYVFIQSPYFMGHPFIRELKKYHDKAIFINYNWDSIINNDYLGYIQYFDKVFSFDQKDCEQNKEIIYLPLFFTSDFDYKSDKTRKYDLSFVGGIGDSEDRYEFIMDMEKRCNLLGITFYYYLYVSPNYFVKSLFKGKFYKGVKFKKLKLIDIANINFNSNCILDYHNPKQNGLTMRTFEALGSGCKLLTTNQNIVNEPFYNDKAINVIDVENKNFSTSFVHDKNISLNQIDRYSIINWVKKIFQV